MTRSTSPDTFASDPSAMAVYVLTQASACHGSGCQRWREAYASSRDSRWYDTGRPRTSLTTAAACPSVIAAGPVRS